MGHRARIARRAGAVCLLAAACLAACGPNNKPTALRPAAADPASTPVRTSPFPGTSTTAAAPSTTEAPTTTTTTAVPRPARPPGPPRVMIFGDSIAWEAHDAFQFFLPGAVVKGRMFWGTAICSWFGYMQQDTESFRPDVVVAEFAGVDFSPCLRGRAPVGSGPAAITAAFRTDAITATGILSKYGAEVIWVGAPVDYQNPDQTLQHMYATLPSLVPHAAYVDAGPSVAPGDVFTWTLPCLPHEPGCRNGTVVVRSPDGRHFCPIQSTLYYCPVWSGGALRFGGAMAAAANSYLQSIGL